MAKKKSAKLDCATKEDGATEQVGPAADAGPSTAEPEAEAITKAKAVETPLTIAERTPLSPYTNNPVIMNVGPAPTIYYVPWHLLQFTNWSALPAGGQINLPTTSADTGHVLVHYLYKGVYQTLDSTLSGDAQHPQHALKRALQVYKASVKYALDGLERLARQQIEEHSASMDLKTILDITRSEMSKNTEPSDWLQAYLQEKTETAFKKDHTVFAEDAFCADLCKKSKLNDHVMRHVIKLLSDKLTQALARERSVAHESGNLPSPEPVVKELVAHQDPFAGLSRGQRRKLEKQMRQEKESAQRDEEEAKAVEHVQDTDIIDDQPPIEHEDASEPASVEKPETYHANEPAPVEEFETRWQASVIKSSVPAPDPGPCYDDFNNIIESEPAREEQPALEPPTSVWVHYVPPPPPKKETATAKKKRLIQESRDRAEWNKKQLERMDHEEKEGPCKQSVPNSATSWEVSALPAMSDTSWEQAEPNTTAVDEHIYDRPDFS